MIYYGGTRLSFIQESTLIRRLHGEVHEAVTEAIDHGLKKDKQQRAAVQKKGHKKKTFHMNERKATPSRVLMSFLEPVTDPKKRQREEEFLKNPFAALEAQRRRF